MGMTKTSHEETSRAAFMTRYVYILIAHENNNYAAMCLISALSVRGVDANAHITVLIDQQTLSMLKRDKHQLLEVADEILDCQVNEPPSYASRVIKTTLLQRLQSDFIFLDVDTILVHPIAQRLRQPYSLQMVLDRNQAEPKPGFPEQFAPYYQQLGWKYPTRQYFNSGVMFVHADETTKCLFDEWHSRWQMFTSCGRYFDQPALNSAIDDLKTPVMSLPLKYNAMVRVDEIYRWGAYVLHFFAEGGEIDKGTEYAKLVADVLTGKTLTSGSVQTAINRRLPLVAPWELRRQLKAGNLQGMLLQYLKRSTT